MFLNQFKILYSIAILAFNHCNIKDLLYSKRKLALLKWVYFALRTSLIFKHSVLNAHIAELSNAGLAANWLNNDLRAYHAS